MSGNLEQLEEQGKKLFEQLSSISGKCDLLKKQQIDIELKLEELSHNKEIYTKAVEVLMIVQKLTKDKIKEGFEQIVAYALRYIYNTDYSFALEFGRRGNLQEVDFNIQTPDCKTAFDPIDSSGGGILDILSLALRIAILELSKPKNEGFLVLDEPFKHVSAQYLDKCRLFIKAINQKIKRQIIMVTHKEELIINADNLISVGKKEEVNV